MTAIYIKNKKISYKELIELIKQVTIKDPIFPVTNTLDCVVKILHCLINNIAFFPYNPQLPQKPFAEIPKDCSIILLTSGSSSQKYVLLKKKDLIEANMFTHRDFFLSPKDVYLLNLPLYHIAAIALLLRAFLRGASIAIDPINKNMITHISAVPTQALKLEEKQNYPNLKALLIGGAPISKDLANTLIKKGFPLYITYGMTEMSSHIFVEKYQKKYGISFSTPLKKREVFLNEKSIMQVCGCGKFLSYLDSKEKKYFNTNDMFFYKNNRYYFQKRADNLFVSGGENIFPEEIKNSLLTHPNIQYVSIKIQDDLKWGKRPFVTIYSNCPSLTKETITTFLENRLEKFKIPKAHEIFLC